MLEQLAGVSQAASLGTLYLLVVLSVVSMGVMIERGLYFSRRKVDIGALGDALVTHLRAHDLPGAQAMLKKSRSVEAEVLDEALGWYDHGPTSVREVLAGGIRKRRADYESGLIFLATLGNNAPFLGLFGTVLGIVVAFRELGKSSAGAMGNVMAGIGEALVATAVGILVALPAVVAYNYFQKRTSDIEENVGALGSQLLAQMESSREVEGARAVVNGGAHPVQVDVATAQATEKVRS